MTRSNLEDTPASSQHASSTTHDYHTTTSSPVATDTTTATEKLQLKRRLELHHGVGVICGLVIGSGIFVSPAGVAQGAGSAGYTLVIWVLGGVLATLGVLTMAELGTTFPSSGEKYVYLQKMYPKFIAFLYLWVYLFFIRCAANAVKVLTVSRLIIQPILGEQMPQPVLILIAYAASMILGYINCVTVKGSARLQIITTTVNCTALCIIVVSGLYCASTESKGSSWDNISFSGTNLDVGSFVLAIYSTHFALGGWNALNYMVEELKNPYKNLPKAIVISMVVILTAYLATNVSYLLVLGVDGVAETKAVAMTYSEHVLGGWAWVVTALIACNLFGGFNSALLVGSRLAFVGAREGHLPRVLSLVQVTRRTPVVSVILQILLVLVMCFFDVFFLINNMTFSLMLFDFLTVSGMVRLRFSQPLLYRPIRLPLCVPVAYCTLTLLFVLIPLILKPAATAMGLTLGICTGLAYYLCFVTRIISSTKIDRLSEKLLTFCEKLFVCLPEEAS